MYPGNQDDQTRRMSGPGGPQAWSDVEPRPVYDDSGYATGGYDGGYPAGRQAPAGAAPGPGIEIGKFAGSAIATALVAAIAGWLVAWIVDAVFQRFGTEWATGGNTPTMYAIYGAVAALLAGLLWYLLLVGTPDPDKFFSWIAGLLIVAAVVLPLLLVTPIRDGIASAIVHLMIGLPILALTGAFGRTFRR